MIHSNASAAFSPPVSRSTAAWPPAPRPTRAGRVVLAIVRAALLVPVVIALASCSSKEEPRRVDAGGPTCIDMDGDSYGQGCVSGPDCDDTSAAQTGTEVCDGADNDCDGMTDEQVRSACGNCDSNCRAVGFGERPPWNLDEDRNEGVIVEPDGSLALVRREFVSRHLIWIANTGEGTVSKVDTRTFTELARYRTGPRGGGMFGFGPDPSRTSVDSQGDVYVGNREGRSVTKISALGAQCPDSNGDGRITTSSGMSDILEWGEDDCVLWNTPVQGGVVRAVAAQEESGPDGAVARSVWIGAYDNSVVYKLDGETGEILLRAYSPVQPYGFALDGRGQLWIASGGDMGRIDTTRCVDDMSCSVRPCRGEGDLTCIIETVMVPDGTYGITVDAAQRVWLGGGSYVKRYDPMAPVGMRWEMGATSFNVHGIAADLRGNVWGAALDRGLVRINAENPADYEVVAATVGSSPKGVAVDADGKIWAINQNHEDATVVVPGSTLSANTVWSSVVPQLVMPYTYSDMTGQQLRIATSQIGRYAHVFDACPTVYPGPTAWIALQVDAIVPAMALLRARARTAESAEDLALAEWVEVGRIPGGTSPFDLAGALDGAGILPGRLLEVELELSSTSQRTFVTPRVRSVDVVYSKSCDVIR